MIDITYEVSGFYFRDIDKLFAHQLILDDDWHVADAKQEIEALLVSELCDFTPQVQPQVTIVSGIPYSGKSTYIANHPHQFQSSVYISFDRLMQKLSYYQNLMCSDNQLAFEKCELIARVVGYELLKRALESKLNIVFEHSSAPQQHLVLYRSIVDNYGYSLRFVYLSCAVQTAMQRASESNYCRDGGRFTPLEYIEQRNTALQAMLEKYRQHFIIEEV